MGTNNNGDVNKLYANIYYALQRACADKDTVQTLRSCAERMEWLTPERRDAVYDDIVAVAVVALENGVAREQCATNNHTFTDWEETTETQSTIGDTVKDTEAWGKVDGVRRYIVEEKDVPVWKCHCTRCGAEKISYVDPKMDGSHRQEEMIRRLNNDNNTPRL